MKRLLLGCGLARLAGGGPPALARPQPGPAACRRDAPDPQHPGAVDRPEWRRPFRSCRIHSTLMLWIRAGGRHWRATIGWRGADRQQRLFAAAVAQHLSVRVASRWALPPSASVHVRGLAVDAGPASGAGWPDRHDMRSGLCRRYADESWHVERLAAALGSRCPAMQAHA